MYQQMKVDFKNAIIIFDWSAWKLKMILSFIVNTTRRALDVKYNGSHSLNACWEVFFSAPLIWVYLMWALPLFKEAYKATADIWDFLNAPIAFFTNIKNIYLQQWLSFYLCHTLAVYSFTVLLVCYSFTLLLRTLTQFVSLYGWYSVWLNWILPNKKICCYLWVVKLLYLNQSKWRPVVQ